MTATRGALANVAIAGVLAAGAVAAAATAAAEPPPVDPAVPTPPPVGSPLPLIGAPVGPNGVLPFAQNGDPSAGPLGIPEISRDELFLGQNAAPSAPGGPPGTSPSLAAFNNAYLLPQNEVPAAPGEGAMFGVAPGAENANLSDIGYLKRLYHLYQDDRLKGGLLGQVDHSQLGAPLPGTAPPPGTALPPGMAPPPGPALPPGVAPPPTMAPGG